MSPRLDSLYGRSALARQKVDDFSVRREQSPTSCACKTAFRYLARDSQNFRTARARHVGHARSLARTRMSAPRYLEQRARRNSARLTAYTYSGCGFGGSLRLGGIRVFLGAAEFPLHVLLGAALTLTAGGAGIL